MQSWGKSCEDRYLLRRQPQQLVLLSNGDVELPLRQLLRDHEEKMDERGTGEERRQSGDDEAVDVQDEVANVP